MSGRGLTAIKRLMNEYKGKGGVVILYLNSFLVEISVNPPEGIFAGITRT